MRQKRADAAVLARSDFMRKREIVSSTDDQLFQIIL